MIPYFGGMSKVSKSGIHAAWILACARRTSSPSCHARPRSGILSPPLTSYPRMRVSRAIIPYFSEVSTSQKSGISVAWMLAFARRTSSPSRHARPRSGIQGNNSLFLAGCQRSLKAVSMLPGCSHAQGGRPEVVSPSGTTCRERWFPSVVTL